MSSNFEKLQIYDEGIIQTTDGKMYMKQPHNTKMIGEVTVQQIDCMGNVLFTETNYNDIVMTGSTMILEKMFNIRANLKISTLSDDMAINNATQPNVNNVKDEFVMGFMVGIGGAGETIGDVKASAFTDKALSSVIPFRVVDTGTLPTADASSYFMKQTSNGKDFYYCKKFDSTPQIRHLFTDGVEVPSNISTTGTTKGIRVFSESICMISSKDLREYFMINDGNLDRCRVNTMGLVAGFAAGSDIAGIRLITELNFKSRYLQNNDDNIKIVYRVYCM